MQDVFSLTLYHGNDILELLRYGGDYMKKIFAWVLTAAICLQTSIAFAQTPAAGQPGLIRGVSAVQMTRAAVPEGLVFDKEKVTQTILDGLQKHAQTISLSDENGGYLIKCYNEETFGDELAAYYQAVIDQNPDMFYVMNGFTYKAMTSGEDGAVYITEITPYYLESLYAQRSFFSDRVDTMLKQIIHPQMTEAERVLAIHDYLADHAVYGYKVKRGEAFREYEQTPEGEETIVVSGMTQDLAQYTTEYTDNAQTEKNPLYDRALAERVMYSHTAYGVLMNGAGVCQSYSLAFKLLAQRAGLECISAINNAAQHEWNMVKVDGQWYHVDVTFDDPVLNAGEDGVQTINQVRHDYLLLTDETIATREIEEVVNNHEEWSVVYDTDLPPCSNVMYEKGAYAFHGPDADNPVYTPMYRSGDKYYYRKLWTNAETYYAAPFADSTAAAEITREEYEAAKRNSLTVGYTQDYNSRLIELYVKDTENIEDITLDTVKDLGVAVSGGINNIDVWVAYYNQEGIMVGCGLAQGTTGEDGKVQIDLSRVDCENARTAKIFVWNGGDELRPIAHAIRIV